MTRVVLDKTYYGKLSGRPVKVDRIVGDDVMVLFVGDRKIKPIPLRKFHLRYSETPTK